MRVPSPPAWLPRCPPLLALSALLLGACPRSGPSSDPPATDPAAAPTVDSRFTSGWIFARQADLHSRLDPSPVGRFARLTPAQRRALDQLLRQPDQRIRLLQAEGRTLIRLPATHPAGELELLLDDDQDQLLLFLPRKQLRVILPREQLPDVLDGTGLSRRADFELELRHGADRPLDRPPGLSLRTRTVAARIPLRYYPTPDRVRSWSLRLKLRLLTVEDPPVPLADAHALLTVALPFLQSEEDGYALLDTLAGQVPAISGWTVTVTNEGKPSAVAPLWRARVVDRRVVRVPRTTFSRQRPGYREVRHLPPLQDGRQLLAAATLRELRAPAPNGPLALNNDSRFSVLIYLDGALLGWVAPRERFRFEGIPAGYYRISGVSPTGLRSWDPVDLYVPGPYTLR